MSVLDERKEELDPKLAASLDTAFARLERYFPEHKVFALSALDEKLRERFSKLYQEAGFATVEELFASRGFEKISGSAVKDLRDTVLYTPGNEPDIIKNNVESILQRLEEYYPDHEIAGTLEKDHKKLGSNISGIALWLGYSDIQSFLEAYGYTYTFGENGRPKSDFQPMLDALVEKYKTHPKPKAIGALTFENPEYAGQLKTLKNECQELYGVTPKKLFQQLGILGMGSVPRGRAAQAARSAGSPETAEPAAPAVLQDYVEPENVTDASQFDYTVNDGRRGQVCIERYHGQESSVVVPGYIEGRMVTTIARGAFQDNPYLTEVILPDTVTSVQGGAFKNCISLSRVHLSNRLTKLVSNTFTGCIGLKEVNIPDGVTELVKGTFRDTQLESLHIGRSMQRIVPGAFYAGEYDEFTGGRKSARALQTLTLDPENPHFQAAGTSLLSADGRTLLLALGDLQHYTVPVGVEVIGEMVFEGQTTLGDITLPDSLTRIESGAFAGSGLRTVAFGRNLRVIGDSAFLNCKNLTGAIFAEGLEEIGSKAFQGCPIPSIQLPASLRKLAQDSFDSLCGRDSEIRQSLRIAQENPWLHADGKLLYTIENGVKTLSVAYGRSLRDYFGHGVTVTLEEGTTAIAPKVFEGCYNLKKAELPEGLRSIGQEAFQNCVNLTSIQMPKSLVRIGSKAFYGTAIKNFQLPKDIEYIGVAAFRTGGGQGNFQIHNIQLSKENPRFRLEDGLLCGQDRLEVLDCFGRKEVVCVPQGVHRICTKAFQGSLVEEVHIPASVTEIDEKAFQDCMKLKRLCVEFPEPENGVRRAVVYLPGVREQADEYVSAKTRNQYMDCIRVGRQGTVFDFVKYDSLFPSITAPKDKILVATDRLKSAIQLAPLYQEAYLSYLQKNAELAVNTVVEFDDLAGLSVLADLGVFTGANIDQVIELANSAQKPEIVGYLMNYKNAAIGFEETDYEL